MPWPQLAMVFTTAQGGGGSAVAESGSPSLASVVAPYMAVFFAAFFVALITTPILRKLALHNGIVDVPDLKRKNHVAPVAYLGGVAIMLGWLAGIVVSYFTEPHNADHELYSFERIVFPVAVILGAGAIVLTGLFDDIYGISPLVKIGGQFFAAAALASQDVGIRLIEGAFTVLEIDPVAMLGAEPANLLIYALGTAVIAVFVVGGCNAVNLLDGLDGLAAGVTALAVMAFLLLAAIVAIRGEGSGLEGVINHPVRIVMCLAILGGVLGFLPYNFNPATIFMGDAGSLLLGYFGVATILMFADVHLKHVTAAMIIFAVPVIDTLLAMIRRKVRGQPLTAPDDGHVHHQLRRRGLSVRQTVVLLYGAQAAFAAIGVTLVALDTQWRYVMAVFCVIYGSVIAFGYNLAARDAAIDELQFAKGPDPDPSLRSPHEPTLPEDPTHGPPSESRQPDKHPDAADAPADAPTAPSQPDAVRGL